MMYDYFPFHYFGFFGPLFGIFFWIAVVFVLVSLFRKEKNGASETHSKAMEILKERYAKGEIDKKEFEDKKKDLTA